MNVKRLTDLIAQGALAGKRVFIRADLNVPQDDAGNITEDTRIRASVPCIRMALDAGAMRMAGTLARMRVSSVMRPSSSCGTLRSARMKTRWPATRPAAMRSVKRMTFIRLF